MAIPMREVYNTRAAAIHDCAGRVDAARNLFISWTELAGNDTVTRVRKYDPAGNLAGEWQVVAPTNMKTDFATLMVSGSDLWVILAAHQPISGERDNKVYYGVIPGVFAAYDGGRDLEGAPFMRDVVGSPAAEVGGGGTVSIDYPRLARAVVDRMKEEMRGELGALMAERARQGVQAEAQATLATKGDLTTALDAGIYNSNGLYQRLIETQYSVLRDNDVLRAVLAVLRDHGLTPSRPASNYGQDPPPAPGPGTPGPPPSR
jgi:hypothetical protein